MNALCLAFTLPGEEICWVDTVRIMESELENSQHITQSMLQVRQNYGQSSCLVRIALGKQFRLFRQTLKQNLTSETSDIHWSLMQYVGKGAHGKL